MFGKIVQILPDKGFFFLRVNDTPPDYFAHKDDLPDGVRIDLLEIGQEFEFESVTTAKGPRAGSLQRVREYDAD